MSMYIWYPSFYVLSIFSLSTTTGIIQMGVRVSTLDPIEWAEKRVVLGGTKTIVGRNDNNFQFFLNLTHTHIFWKSWGMVPHHSVDTDGVRNDIWRRKIWCKGEWWWQRYFANTYTTWPSRYYCYWNFEASGDVLYLTTHEYRRCWEDFISSFKIKWMYSCSSTMTWTRVYASVNVWVLMCWWLCLFQVVYTWCYYCCHACSYACSLVVFDIDECVCECLFVNGLLSSS